MIMITSSTCSVAGNTSPPPPTIPAPLWSGTVSHETRQIFCIISHTGTFTGTFGLRICDLIHYFAIDQPKESGPNYFVGLWRDDPLHGKSPSCNPEEDCLYSLDRKPEGSYTASNLQICFQWTLVIPWRRGIDSGVYDRSGHTPAIHESTKQNHWIASRQGYGPVSTSAHRDYLFPKLTVQYTLAELSCGESSRWSRIPRNNFGLVALSTTWRETLSTLGEPEPPQAWLPQADTMPLQSGEMSKSWLIIIISYVGRSDQREFLYSTQIIIIRWRRASLHSTFIIWEA